MAVMTSRLFSWSAGTPLLDAFRQKVQCATAEAVSSDLSVPARPLNADQSRYERLLEHELDRQLLTEVEREDSDMLDRVRCALYAED